MHTCAELYCTVSCILARRHNGETRAMYSIQYTDMHDATATLFTVNVVNPKRATPCDSIMLVLITISVTCNWLVARVIPHTPDTGGLGGWRLGDGVAARAHKSKEHLSVAHFVAGPRSQELRCSRAHCASSVVLRFSISVPCLSQSHRTSPLTSLISARRRRRRGPDLQKLSWSTASKGARVCW